MKIKVDLYEIEITAKISDMDATLYLLNELSIAFRNSRKYNMLKGYNSLADRDKKVSDEFFKICEEAGLYE